MRELVLLHGWAMTPAVWEPVVPALSASARVHNLALPGYAAPAACDGSPGAVLDHWSDECLAAAPAGAVWVAWSLGALIALNAVLRAGGAIAALVLVAATPKFARAADWPAGTGVDVLNGFLEGIQSGDERILKRFVMLQAGGPDDPRRLARALSPCVVDQRVRGDVLAAGLRVLEGVDLRSRLGDVAVPVRVVHGAGDRVVPFAAGAHVAGHVPDGDLVRLDTGHAPFVTHPETFAQAVRAWM